MSKGVTLEGLFTKNLQRVRPDFVLINCGHLDGAPDAAACRKLGLPYGMLVQLADDSQWPSDSLRKACKAMYAEARVNIFVSKRNLELVERMTGQRLANAFLVRNPCQLLPAEPLPWPVNGTWRLAMPARLEVQDKGHDLLLHLLAKPEWRARPVELNLYGHGRHEQGIRELAQLLDLGDRVCFRGHEDDLESIWRHNHLAVLPSRAEGLPLALIEAMGAGRPAMVTDIGGNAELVEEGRTGFIAEAPALCCLERAMERAWLRRDEWQQMGVSAHFRIKELWKENPAATLAAHIQRAALVPGTKSNGPSA
jgi:glycosyltransferase involved in cell wall biosynthesis